MPRTHVRKRPNPTYTPQDLMNAVNDVSNKNKTYRQAEEVYGIPIAVIYHRIKGRKVPIEKLGAGRPPVLDDDTENQIVLCLIARARMGYPCDKEELRDLVSEYVKVNNVKNPFKDDRPGEDWYHGFMKRHPTLSLKKAEHLQTCRSPVDLQQFDPGFEEGFDPVDLQQYKTKKNQKVSLATETTSNNPEGIPGNSTLQEENIPPSTPQKGIICENDESPVALERIEAVTTDLNVKLRQPFPQEATSKTVIDIFSHVIKKTIEERVAKPQTSANVKKVLVPRLKQSSYGEVLTSTEVLDRLKESEEKKSKKNSSKGNLEIDESTREETILETNITRDSSDEENIDDFRTQMEIESTPEIEYENPQIESIIPGVYIDSIIRGSEHRCVPNVAKNKVEVRPKIVRKRARKETTSIPEIFREEMVQIMDSGLELVTEIPSFTTKRAQMYSVRQKASSVAKFKDGEEVLLADKMTNKDRVVSQVDKASSDLKESDRLATALIDDMCVKEEDDIFEETSNSLIGPTSGLSSTHLSYIDAGGAALSADVIDNGCVKRESDDLFEEINDSLIDPTSCSSTLEPLVASSTSLSIPDEFDTVGFNVASKLRNVDKTQGIIAERIIAETLFQAEMGTLTIRDTWSDMLPSIPLKNENRV